VCSEAEAAPAAPSASTGSASAAASSSTSSAPAKRSKRNVSRPAAVGTPAAMDAPVAAAAASARAAVSSVSAPSGPHSALLESCELLALLTGPKLLDQKCAEVHAKLKEELQRVNRGEPWLLNFDLPDSERPDSGGTLLTALVRLFWEIGHSTEPAPQERVTQFADDSFARTLALLLEVAPVNVHARDDGWSALQLACAASLPWPRTAATALLRVLLMRGADINAPDPEGKPPLLRFATMIDESGCGNSFSVLLMLGHGASINAQDSDGDTIMHVFAAVQPRVADFKEIVA